MAEKHVLMSDENGNIIYPESRIADVNDLQATLDGLHDKTTIQLDNVPMEFLNFMKGPVSPGSAISVNRIEPGVMQRNTNYKIGWRKTIDECQWTLVGLMIHDTDNAYMKYWLISGNPTVFMSYATMYSSAAAQNILHLDLTNDTDYWYYTLRSTSSAPNYYLLASLAGQLPSYKETINK